MRHEKQSFLVADPRGRNHATYLQNDATPGATGTQPLSLKALASAVLLRNQARNQHATKAEKTTQLIEETDPPKLQSRSDGPARVWVAGWPFVCACGTPTGWTTEGVGICPACAADPDP
jgi:hypothetical protein